MLLHMNTFTLTYILYCKHCLGSTSGCRNVSQRCEWTRVAPSVLRIVRLGGQVRQWSPVHQCITFLKVYGVFKFFFFNLSICDISRKPEFCGAHHAREFLNRPLGMTVKNRT